MEALRVIVLLMVLVGRVGVGKGGSNQEIEGQLFDGDSNETALLGERDRCFRQRETNPEPHFCPS